MRPMIVREIIILCAMFLSSAVLAHSPLCDCYVNGNSTVTCEGGFTDGSSAKGVAIRVVDPQNKVLLAGEMDENSQYTFQVPAEEYHVVFDAGDNHTVTIYSGDITE